MYEKRETQFPARAQSKDSLARHWLAHHLEHGDGIEQNRDEAAKIWQELSQKSSEYPKGDEASQYRLGALLYDRDYSGYNPKEGITFLRKSAEQNYDKAQFALGMLYYNGYEDIVKQDWKEARRWLRKAAKQKHDVAQYYLAEIYLNGNGVPVNRKEAFKWYKASSSTGFVSAMQKYVYCCLNGIGTKKDEEEGYNKYQRMKAEKEENPFSRNFDRAFREAKRTIWAVSPSAGDA